MKEPPPPLPAIQPTHSAPRQQAAGSAAGGRRQGKFGKASAGRSVGVTPRASQGGIGAVRGGSFGGSFGGGFSYNWDEDDYTEEPSGPRALDLGAFLKLPVRQHSQVLSEGWGRAVGWAIPCRGPLSAGTQHSRAGSG